MTRVYVGGLPVDIRPDDVMYEFRRYEPLRVDLKQGFGFLEFREPRDADDAVHDMDGHKIGGRPIAVQFARGTQRRDMPGGPRGGSYDDRGGRGGGYGPPPSFGGGGAMKKGSGYQVEVEGLDSRTSWQDLKDFARGAGNVQFADVFIRHGKKIGLIEYPSKEDVDNAVRKLDDTKLDGAVVRLYEVKKDGSGGGRGRSRSRSPAARRDRSHSPRRSRSRSPRRDDRGSRGADRDDRRDRSRSRSPRRDRSKSLARETSSSGNGSSDALPAISSSSSGTDVAAPKQESD